MPRIERSTARARIAATAFPLFAFALLAAVSVQADVTGESVQLGGRAVRVWQPENPAPAPVLIFSHGFHGCATQSGFLMRAFVDAGYIVFAPNHRDATCNGGSAYWIERPQQPFQKPDAWSDATYRDRADDVAAVIAALGTDERFRGRVDLDRLGLVGHSLGGYTVLGLGGAWPSWKMPGVKAVLALSPYTNPYLAKATLGGVAVPVMYQGGTRDVAITPSVAKDGGAYALTPAPKYFVEFDGAGHLAWTDVRDTDHDEIVAYSVAFANRYVRGAADVAQLTQKLPEVTVLQYEAGKTDVP
ncbi:MAG TPA: dienelactone hydrolase family protein [Pseudomonadales bacterium]|nr:dienelactone hydrolase family protein [Pseudomonadales bacterium]